MSMMNLKLCLSSFGLEFETTTVTHLSPRNSGLQWTVLTRWSSTWYVESLENKPTGLAKRNKTNKREIPEQKNFLCIEVSFTPKCVCANSKDLIGIQVVNEPFLIHNPPLNYITNHQQLFVHCKLKKTTKAASCRKNIEHVCGVIQ